MVLIAVNSFRYRGSLGLYELPEGSSIIDLKAEIEATEGIPIGHQRLLRKQDDGQDLKNNENLDSLLSDHSSEAIIYLVQAQVFYRLTRRLEDTIECNETSNFPPQKRVVDLDKPIRAYRILGELHRIDLSAASISVLGSDERPAISISDLDQSFSYYGICNGDTIHIVYRSDIQGTLLPIRTSIRDCIPPPREREHTIVPFSFSCFDEHTPVLLYDEHIIVRAKYDWNGEIMHPNLKGLSLKRTALFTISQALRHNSPGWLYGSPVSPSEDRLSGLFTRRLKGYFPENYVSRVDLTTEQHSEVTITEILDVPPLPPFHFPPASGMTFRMPISDKGHSFLKFTVNYERVSSPVDPAHVIISLLCTTHDIRRISAVSVFITIPEGAPLDVQVCENEAHQKEIHTDKEVTETQLKGKHFDGINIGTHGTTVGFQGGVSRNYSLGSTEKGQKVSRRKVTVRIDKDDTICWNLKAPTSNLDEDGLDGEESITLVLKKKPVEFKYNCRVTHARNGVEKTTQRITDSRPWSKFFG